MAVELCTFTTLTARCMAASQRISVTKMQELMDCFDEFSESKDYLDKDDLKVAVTALLGFRPSKYEVNQMLAWAATETPAKPGDHGIPWSRLSIRLPRLVSEAGMSKELFIESMSRRLALVDAAEDVRQMFKAFDRGCRGFITRDDLRMVISEAFSEEEMPSAKVAEMFAEADWDSSGRIGYRQFEAMVTDRLPSELMRRQQYRSTR